MTSEPDLDQQKERLRSSLAKLMDVAIKFQVEHVEEVHSEVTVVPRGLESLATQLDVKIKPNGESKTKDGWARDRIGMKNVIMQHYERGVAFTCLRAENWLQYAGYSQNSAGPVLKELTASGHLKHTGKGEYEFARNIKQK